MLKKGANRGKLWLHHKHEEFKKLSLCHYSQGDRRCCLPHVVRVFYEHFSGFCLLRDKSNTEEKTYLAMNFPVYGEADGTKFIY